MATALELMKKVASFKKRDKNPAELIELYATAFILHHKLTVFAVEINSPSFYEHHTFMNAMAAAVGMNDVGMCYRIRERIKVLHGTVPSDLQENIKLSRISFEKKAPTDPVKMYKILYEDFKTFGAMCELIFERNAKEGIAGTVALISSICEKADHYYWETGAMAGEYKS
jgi:DNA-binding ferritin-like protein